MNYLILEALSLLKAGFIDIGSKYHQICSFYGKSFKAVRAPIYAYDKIYLENKHVTDFP